MRSPRTIISPRSSGFTLVELLVAMAILVTVSAATALVFRGVTRAWRAGSLRTERYQQARLLFDLFGRELTAGVVNSRYPLLGTKPTETARLREGSEFDELFFVGAFPGRAGFVERGYWVDAEQNLMCHDDEPADEDYATGTSEVCGRDIATFTLSYFDGSTWLDEWDAQPSAAQAGRLPKAIHISLSIGSQHPEQFETVIYLPAS